MRPTASASTSAKPQVSSSSNAATPAKPTAASSSSAAGKDVYSALDPYTPLASEKDGLALSKGEEVTVVERNGDWWWCETLGPGAVRAGWAPSTFLVKKTAGGGGGSKAALKPSGASKAGPSSKKKGSAQSAGKTKPTARATSAGRGGAGGGGSKAGSSRYTALDDFKAASEEELSFKRGESLTVEEINGDWFFAKNSRGKTGWVPSTFLNAK